MVMDSSGKFNFNLSTVLPLSWLTLSSSPDSTTSLLHSMKWVWRWFGIMERICSTNHSRLLLTPSNTNNQQLNSRDYIPERTAHFTLACCCFAAAAANSNNHLEPPPSIVSATFIINAMPGSQDPLFDVSHKAGLILSKLSSKFQLPLQLRRKIQTTKNVIELCLFTKFSSLMMFYCSLLGNKKLFCDPMKTWWSEVSTKYYQFSKTKFNTQKEQKWRRYLHSTFDYWFLKDCSNATNGHEILSSLTFNLHSWLSERTKFAMIMDLIPS